MVRFVLLLSLLLTYAFTVSAQPVGKLVRRHPGIVSYTFRDEFAKDVPATLDHIRQLGITDLELSNLFGKTAAEFRTWLNERGIQCSSYGVSYDDIQKKPAEVLQNAKTLGVQFVRVAWIPHEGAFDTTMVRKAAAVFNTFGQLARQQGITFCYHNHGYEFAPYGQGTIYDELMRLTNPDYVSFEMDIAWTFLPGQNPATLLAKYPKRFRLMHLKDIRKGVPGNDQGKLANENSVILGTGQLDWPTILKAVNQSSITHLYIEDESQAATEQVPQSIAYLKGL
ncbi:sugar phosphate isomerase/epimerase family protein [Fibrella aquatilis]|uniref:TIM barrel protein n=1 Tax=Fibrella aquatilis TaxID=2817059 RepID=A0A939G6D9_9BACT|nr:TIM barrel protein [Fibrella aquatilis]MBO0931454.1 TIM barrel protein [Fibrella aquatilis]